MKRTGRALQLVIWYADDAARRASAQEPRFASFPLSVVVDHKKAAAAFPSASESRSTQSNMSYHIYPMGGRENVLRRRPRYPPQMLKALPATNGMPFTTTVNSGWNDPVLLPVSRVEGRRPEPEWSSPIVNVLPSQQKLPSINNRPFGSTAALLPTISRTSSLQSLGARSEHLFSEPTRGVPEAQRMGFFNSTGVPTGVPGKTDRWRTSNRAVFRQRTGVLNSSVSESILMKVNSASNGFIPPSEHGSAKPYVRLTPRPPTSTNILTVNLAPSRVPPALHAPGSSRPCACRTLLSPCPAPRKLECCQRSPLKAFPTLCLRVPQMSRSQHCWERVNPPHELH